MSLPQSVVRPISNLPQSNLALFQVPDPVLAGTIIRIIPVLLVIFVIIEFHALNDMIAEPDADIGVRWDVSGRRGRASAHGEPRHGVKPVGEVDFIGGLALDPGPTVSLPAAGEGQMNAIRLGLCPTDADEPAVVGNSTSNGDADK